jgi:dTDP-4-dehydrorhamnose reductase
LKFLPCKKRFVINRFHVLFNLLKTKNNFNLFIVLKETKPKRKVLLTGASGFVGGHVFTRCPPDIYLVPVCGKHSLPNCIQMDLTQEIHLISELDRVKPDIIIHSAANSNLDICEKDPKGSFRINARVPGMLAQWCGDHNTRLIHFSSDMVFNGTLGMYSENDTVAPLSAYGEQKAESEILVLEKCNNAVVARCALVYGRPSGTGLGSSFSMWIEERLATGKKVPLFVDQYRTPIWVHNLAALIWELALNSFCGILHLGGSNRINRYDFGQELCSALNYDKSLLIPSTLEDHDAFARRPRDVSLDTSLAQQKLRTIISSTAESIVQWI